MRRTYVWHRLDVMRNGDEVVQWIAWRVSAAIWAHQLANWAKWPARFTVPFIRSRDTAIACSRFTVSVILISLTAIISIKMVIIHGIIDAMFPLDAVPFLLGCCRNFDDRFLSLFHLGARNAFLYFFFKIIVTRQFDATLIISCSNFSR